MFLMRGTSECSLSWLPIFSRDWKIFRVEVNTPQDSGLAMGGWSLEQVGKLASPSISLRPVFIKDHRE